MMWNNVLLQSRECRPLSHSAVFSCMSAVVAVVATYESATVQLGINAATPKAADAIEVPAVHPCASLIAVAKNAPAMSAGVGRTVSSPVAWLFLWLLWLLSAQKFSLFAGFPITACLPSCKLGPHHKKRMKLYR